MSHPYLEEMRAVFRAIRIVSPVELVFAGQPVSVRPAVPQAPVPMPNAPGLAANGGQGAAPAPGQNSLVVQLSLLLYEHAYCRRFDGTLRPYQPPGSLHDSLLEALSEANSGRERWDPGWQILQLLPNGQVAVQKFNVTRTLWPGEFISMDGPGSPPRPGALVTIFSPKESRTMQPGFYFAFGESVAEGQDLYDSVRFYWNLHAEGAVPLMRSLTQALNRFQVPFRFKCSSFRSLFYRRDSGVLYVNKCHYHVTAHLLDGIYREAREWVDADTPLMTRRLAPGLAFAEDPGSGESFGSFCCRLLAEGIWAAYLQGMQGVEQRVEAVKKQFESSGLVFADTYRRPGSVYPYEFPRFHD